jgi:hypothetical protein
MDREPEPWETSATGPFLVVGDVGVRSLGRDRFAVVSPGEERIVEGFGLARQLAHDLAERRLALTRTVWRDGASETSSAGYA